VGEGYFVSSTFPLALKLGGIRGSKPLPRTSKIPIRTHLPANSVMILGRNLFWNGVSAIGSWYPSLERSRLLVELNGAKRITRGNQGIEPMSRECVLFPTQESFDQSYVGTLIPETDSLNYHKLDEIKMQQCSILTFEAILKGLGR